MLPKYESYFEDVAVYIINRIRAEGTKEEIVNELVSVFKMEVFVELPQENLWKYLETFVAFCFVAEDVAKQTQGQDNDTLE